MERHVGIAGIGTYLPPEVRTNDWWPREIVDRWMVERRAAPPPRLDGVTPAMQRVLAAMAQQAIDPFQGTVRRHVMPAGMTSVEMEAEAARAALAHRGIAPGEIDLVLAHTPMPEFLLSNTACILHELLGLSPDCRTMQLDASGNSFLMQLSIAEGLIAAGKARCALIVQSAAGSRLLEPEEPQSPLFGDGAAATIVAAVDRPSILASAFRTDGKNPRALIASVRGGRWYDGGRIVLHRGDLAASFRNFVETADRATEVIEPALAKAGVRAADVDLFAAHQGTPWLREVVMDVAGLSRARHHDIFDETAYLFGASIPFVLEAAERDGLVEDGQLALLLGGGIGATMGAVVMRWWNPAR